MRPIKFRIWDEYQKKMREPWDVPGDIQVTNINEYFKENQEFVMQFTGLLDKNGKEIYEDDKVRLVYIEDEGGGWTSKVPSEGRVIFDDFWGVKFDCRDGTQRTADSHWGKVYGARDCARIEIIGNIYESPDLIK